MDNRSGRDLLSDLPESIVAHILMLAPFQDAAKTSILSSKWRYRWASLPYLIFDSECEDSSVYTQDRLKRFITFTLLFHKGPIHKFKLSVQDIDSCRDTDHWFISLSKNDIRELFIKVGFDWFWIPSCLYSCQKLTHLELFRCELCPPPPVFKGFVYLRSLILQYVKVHSRAIEIVVANSPLLENLKCVYSGSSELQISAPNLKCFYLEGHFKDICLDAPLLTEIYVALPEQLQGEKSLVCNYTKLLGSLSNLENLIGHECVIKHLSIGIESCHHFLVFHRLEVIRLCEVNFEDVKETLVVFCLLTNAPNLHKLQISCGSNKGDDGSEAPRAYSWGSECPRDCTFNQLKVIMIADFCGVQHEMKFVEFLLETSPMLEAMIIAFLHEPRTNHNTLNSRAELLRFQRASMNAEISFL